MIKVLMVAGDMHVGGIENQLMHLARNIDRKKFQIDFTSTKPDAFYREEIEKLGGKFILIPPIRWKKPQEYCTALCRVMKEGGYDIVHSHELFHSGITLWLAKKAGISCRFVHAHNWRDDDGIHTGRSFVRTVYNFIMQLLIHRYSTVQIACSTWAGRFLYGEKWLRRDSFHLVYNSVDVRKYLDHYGETACGEFCDDNWTNVLNVGRLTSVKNQLFLVDLAEEFRRRKAAVRILCAGSGDSEYEEKVRAKIQEKDLEAYIKLLGPRRDVDVLMRKSRAFVLPSYYEGMPLVMIEAQAAGLPCVSASTYSPEVDFGLGQISWMASGDGVTAWADTVLDAIEHQKPDKQLVEAAISEKQFHSQAFTEKMIQLYQQEVSGRKKAT